LSEVRDCLKSSQKVKKIFKNFSNFSVVIHIYSQSTKTSPDNGSRPSHCGVSWQTRPLRWKLSILQYEGGEKPTRPRGRPA